MKKKKKPTYIKIEYPIGFIFQRIIVYAYSENGLMLSHIEDMLYNDSIVSELEETGMLLSNGYKRDLINKFITAFSDIRLSKPVSWLFKYRINETFPIDEKKEKHPIDDKFVNIVKEVIWATYYFATKPANRLVIVGSPHDIISRLQGIYFDGSVIATQFNTNRNEYIENILSLKDARYGFLPHPDHIAPDDLEAVLIENGAMTDELFGILRNIGTTPITPYERYHLFEFVRRLTIERLQEHKNVTVT